LLNKNARILIVDDDENIRKTMKAILEDEGYKVDLAASGKEAIAKTNEAQYNLAIFDIRLPDMEGVELLNLVKETVPRTRKIMVTGYPTMQNAISAVNKKADAYLIKPVDIKNMLTVIETQLKQQEDEKALSEEKVAEFIESRIKDI